MSDEDREAASALGNLLYDRYPKAFVHPRLKGKGMSPLKIGIDKDIKAEFPDVPNRVIRLFLAGYTGSTHYRRRGTMVGTVRVDLAGNAVSVVNADHARNSERHLARITSRHKPRSDDCPATGKVCFDSVAEAAEYGRATLSRTGGDPAMAKGFRCEHCGRFHWANRLPPTNELR